MKFSCLDVLLIGLVGVVEGAEESVTLMQHTKKMSIDSDGDLIHVHSSTLVGSPAECAERYTEATNSLMGCMANSSLANPKFFEYVSNNHDIGQSQLVDMWFNMAKAEALSTISEECSPTQTFRWDPEEVALIHYAGKKSALELVRLNVEMLEDPRIDVAIVHKFGDAKLAEYFRTTINSLRTVCGGEPETLFDAQEGCRDHLNLDAFLEMVQKTVMTCTTLESSALMQHRVLRQRRDHTRAKLVQVLHAPTNRLGRHFHAHLHVGGSEFNMDLLISHAVSNANLTARQVAMLQHIESSHPLEHLASTCSTWESQRSNVSDPILAKSVLLQNKDYRTYIDCLCHGNELKVVCQATFMKNIGSLSTDLHRMQRKQLGTQKTFSIEKAEKLNTSTWASPHIGPCLLSDAFSCEVCLASFCAPVVGRPKSKHVKNKAGENPFVVVKNALTAKATDFKISCTACASLHPAEQVSFELEMVAETNFAHMSTMFTETKISVDAKTCIGPGSPIRALADTLGINVCMSSLKAEYMPFLGDLDVQGRAPGLIGGTQIVLNFGTAIHDPPAAVRNFCTDSIPKSQIQCTRKVTQWQRVSVGSWSFTYPIYACHAWGEVTLSDAEIRSRSDSCYNNYKDKAGPTLFSAAATIPLVTGGDFEIVKVEGPHSSGITWRVQLFQLPFDKVEAWFRNVWDTQISPAMEEALNVAGDGVETAGVWTLGAANSAGKWTVGAAHEIDTFRDDASKWPGGAWDDFGKFADGAGSDMSDGVEALSDAGGHVGEAFAGGHVGEALSDLGEATGIKIPSIIPAVFFR